MVAPYRNSAYSLSYYLSNTAALLLTFGTSASFAQEMEAVSATAEEEFNEWDADGGNILVEDEFDTAFDEGDKFFR